jgi:hypothetical protein
VAVRRTTDGGAIAPAPDGAIIPTAGGKQFARDARLDLESLDQPRTALFNCP